MSVKFQNITGKSINDLTAIKVSHIGKNSRVFWDFKCACGNITKIDIYNFLNGHVKSCGCRLTKANQKRGTHGATETTEYIAWLSMKPRCYNPKNNRYNRYGARGITVCERWLNSFENFIKDMGLKPSPQHSIERKDVNGNYEPGNCVWATAKEQARNRHNNLIVDTPWGRMCLVEASEHSGINYNTLMGRHLRDEKDLFRKVK